MSQLHEKSQHEQEQAINLDNLESGNNENEIQGEQNDSMMKEIIEKSSEQVLLEQNQNVERDKFEDKIQQFHAEEQQQQDQDIHQTAKQLTHDIASQNHQINFILDRFRSSKYERPALEKSTMLKSISKQERLYKMIPSFFSLGCKNRNRMVKGKTFDQIQNQLKFMDLQKFVNFCTDFQLQKVVSRQILIETFKKYALNRITLDLDRFSKIIKILLEKNPSLLDLLLQNENVLKAHINKSKFQKILTDRQTTLSKYNYKLRPINGKDIESIEQDLKEKKQIKELLRRNKQQSMILRKKQGNLANNDSNKRKISKNNAISESKLNVLSPNQISKWMRKPKHRNYSEKFNPESLVTNIINDGDDEYLEQYESRIWKKDRDNTGFISNYEVDGKSPTTNESILETALSKRIERGNKVIKKITSSCLKNYV